MRNRKFVFVCISIFVIIFLLNWILFPKMRPTKVESTVFLDLRTLVSNIPLQSRWGNKYESYVINNSKCQIPSLNPFHPEVLPYFEPKEYVQCQSKGLLTYIKNENNISTLHVNNRFVNEYSNEGVQCCYSVINRGKPKLTKPPDRVVNLSPCKYFNQKVILSESFVLVSCKSRISRKEVYRNVHAIVRINKNVQDKLKTFQNVPNPHLGVLLIGIDSISRSSIIRAAPTTYSFLTKMNWLEFKGYNKIALNTFPNVMGILTGMNDTTAYQRCNPKDLQGLDKCEMIWYDYRKLGYITGYGEDMAKIGTFNYLKKGFKQEPTDYYFRPYMQAAEAFLPIKRVDSMKYCTGPETAGERILNLAKDFALTFKNVPNFGFFWMNSYSHDSLNGISRMDQKITDFLINIAENDVLENNIVIFMSDHGFRYGSSFLYTHTGWLEDRLPFLFMSVPDRFKTKYPEKYKNLITNRNRLITPYDMYMTLQDILVMSRKNYTVKKSSACPNCKSLFEEVPNERSCEDAGIEQRWCTCNGYITISNDSLIATEAAKFIIKKIPETQKNTGGNYENCMEFQFKKNIYAGISDTNTSSSVSYILIIFQTYPKAVFQGIASINWNTPVPQFQNEAKISRLDQHGKHSSCVNDSVLKEYCYCYSKLRSILPNLFL